MDELTITLSARFSYRKGLVKQLHCHSEDNQLQLVIQGGAMVTVDGKSFPIKSGNGLLIHQGSTHSYSVGRDGMKTLEVKFATDKLEYQELLARIPTVFLIEGMQLVKLFDKIIDERFIRQSGFQVLSSCLLGEALVYLDRSCSAKLEGIGLNEVLLDSNAPPPIKAVNEFVSRHIDHKFSLSELANGCGYNQDYLYRIVSKEFGMSLVQYVNSLRLESAKRYLLHSELPMTEIAWNLGFDTIQSFSKFFRHNCGESPSKFLKRVLDQHQEDYASGIRK